ncbi:MAG TPA: hypothetical protein VFK31_09495 [Rhodanobacteraceae bacterium]|nr:hypothetical protein [Rhodanobacteraceae bacterium]
MSNKRSGIERIADERLRQIGYEGWTAAHDDEHSDGSLAAAAACYATPFPERMMDYSSDTPHGWPFSASWWKPGDGTLEGRIRELEKAGALIVAEIDRLLREKGG